MKEQLQHIMMNWEHLSLIYIKIYITRIILFNHPLSKVATITDNN